MIKNIAIGIMAFILIATAFGIGLQIIANKIDCKSFNQQGKTAF